MPEGIQRYGSDNPSTEADTTTRYGLIAQEVKAALDKEDAVDFDGWTTDASGVEGVGAAAFIYPLIKAVQELSAEVKELKKEK